MDEYPSVTIGTRGQSLTIHSPDEAGSSFIASLDLGDLAASHRVYFGYYDPAGMVVEFFRRLADDWKGWDGPRQWSTYEGDFRLRCWHDRIGHVSVEVEMGHEPIHESFNPEWKVSAVVVLEPGALEAVATAFEHLFKTRSDRLFGR